jgi:diphosphomevalonate decarboxylase
MSSIKEMRSVTVQAPVNIAVIKYWGKLEETLIIPLNDSISGTLSTDHLHAMTSVMVSEDFDSDRMWLNGEEAIISENKRLIHCLQQLRSRSKCSWKELKVHICSKNNFPTAAGLASSAAGYSCLVYALGQIFDITDKTELTILARMGSGSAIRSIFGGFVQWVAGNDSNTSIARQIVDHKHWPEMRVIVMVVNDKKKETGSTVGMQTSVKTSLLLKYRAAEVVPKRIEAITQAILSRDFGTFAEITMKDSNQFHAIAQDTWPPIRYMNDTSWEIIRLVQSYNDFRGAPKVAYTFDAGPNACLYLLEEVVPEMMALIKRYFPPQVEGGDFIRGIKTSPGHQLAPDLVSFLDKKGNCINTGSIKYLINTNIGDGPRILPQKESLLTANGLPK